MGEMNTNNIEEGASSVVSSGVASTSIFSVKFIVIGFVALMIVAAGGYFAFSGGDSGLSESDLESGAKVSNGLAGGSVGDLSSLVESDESVYIKHCGDDYIIYSVAKDIYIYDLNEDEKIKLLDSADYDSIYFYDEVIVWSSSNNDESFLRVYDFSLKKIDEVYSTKEDIDMVYSHNNFIFWSEPDKNDHGRLYRYNLDDGEQKEITTSQSYLHNYETGLRLFYFAVSPEGYIYWKGSENSQGSRGYIYLHDVDTGETIQLTDHVVEFTGYFRDDFFLWNVWGSSEEDGGNWYLCDLNTKEIMEIDMAGLDNLKDDGPDDDVWTHFLNKYPSWEGRHYNGGNELYAYSFQTGKIVEITKEVGLAESSHFDDDFIFWRTSDDEDTLFVYDLKAEETIPFSAEGLFSDAIDEFYKSQDYFVLYDTKVEIDITHYNFNWSAYFYDPSIGASISIFENRSSGMRDYEICNGYLYWVIREDDGTNILYATELPEISSKSVTNFLVYNN